MRQPASLQRSRHQLPKLFEVNGAPCSVIRKVRFPRGTDAKTTTNCGCIGMSNAVSVFS